MDISIVTFTLGGREEYLAQCIISAVKNSYHHASPVNIEHHIVFQGCKYPETLEHIRSYARIVKNYTIHIHEWPENIGIGAGLNKILPECKGSLIFKMDDDCEIVTRDFFTRAMSIHKAYPTAIFSPQPLGLVNNMAGPPGHSRSVYYDQTNDKYYMLRNVHHVGGFARLCPKSIFESFSFQPDLIKGISGTEDGQLSQYAAANNIPMFYVETGMAVEHQEGLGQIARYPEYFRERSGDLQTYEKWVK
jgi:hypothetical protein